MSTTRNLCSFWLQDLFFGIEVLTVQEVIRQHDFTPVPLASDVVTGLMNLRGQIITIVDLRLRLGLPARDAGVQPMHMVVQTDGGPVSFAVDRIGDVVQVSSDAFETPPGNLTEEASDLILGAHKLENVLLLELDAGRVLSDLVQANSASPRKST
jgi:purine-binding chemotaxis protein CheW